MSLQNEREISISEEDRNKISTETNRYALKAGLSLTGTMLFLVAGVTFIIDGADKQNSAEMIVGFILLPNSITTANLFQRYRNMAIHSSEKLNELEKPTTNPNPELQPGEE